MIATASAESGSPLAASAGRDRAGNPLEQRALVGLAGDNRGAGGTPLQCVARR